MSQLAVAACLHGLRLGIRSRAFVISHEDEAGAIFIYAPGSLDDDLVPAIVRIKSSDGQIIGAGFLIATRTVVTCAHVVTQAIVSKTESKNAQEDLFVSIEFACRYPAQHMRARVVWKSAVPDCDVALLELEEDPPDPVRPVKLMRATGTSLLRHRFYALGYPPESNRGVQSELLGVWAHGQIMARVSNGWIQLQDDQVPGARIRPGFSGTPVWDDDLHMVVGMVVAARNAAEEKIGYLIPGHVVYGACLGGHNEEHDDRVLRVRPLRIDLGEMNEGAAYYAKVALYGDGDIQPEWECRDSGNPLAVRLVPSGIMLYTEGRPGGVSSCLAVASSTGQATVVVTGRTRETRRSNVPGTLAELLANPSYARPVDAVATLQKWARSTIGIPGNLFDDCLSITNATAVRLRISRFNERRQEVECESSASKIPAQRYDNGIGTVDISRSWDLDKNWIGVCNGSLDTVPCEACLASGLVACGTCGGIGEVACPEKVRCPDCLETVGPDEDTGAEAGENQARCIRCGGSMEIDCPRCNVHGKIACQECKGNRTQQCGDCDGKGQITRYIKGTISQTVTMASRSAGLYNDGIEIKGVQDSDYEPLCIDDATVKILPLRLQRFLNEQLEASWSSGEEQRRVGLDLLQALAVTYRYGRHERIAFILGRERRVWINAGSRVRYVGITVRTFSLKALSDLMDPTKNSAGGKTGKLMSKYNNPLRKRPPEITSE